MIYLDNAATTKPNEKAVSLSQKYLTTEYFNPSALYSGGFAVSADLKRAREYLLSRVADPMQYELTITSCGSEADNQAVFGFAKRGNVVTTSGEHAAIYASCMELKNRGVDVRFAPVHADGSVDVEALLNLVDDKTTLVSVIHVNNETGAVNPIAEIAKKVKAKNARTVFHSDGVQAYGKVVFRIPKEVDLYSISAHKIGGLKGTGALIRKKGVPVPPYIYGGGQENGKRSGTENVFGIMTFYHAAEDVFPSISERRDSVRALNDLLWSGLDKNLFRRLSPENGSPYILSVSAVGVRGEVLQRMLSDNGVVVGTGSACSSKHRFSRVMTACGYDEKVLDGVIRLSLGMNTTKEEIIKATEILNTQAAVLKEKMQ